MFLLWGASIWREVMKEGVGRRFGCVLDECCIVRCMIEDSERVCTLNEIAIDIHHSTIQVEHR